MAHGGLAATANPQNLSEKTAPRAVALKCIGRTTPNSRTRTEEWLIPATPVTNTDATEDPVRRTAAPVELVNDLYDDEVTKLKADATVESYIPVIASQRVKRRLRTRRRSGAQKD
jgi:hypothetical protein